MKTLRSFFLRSDSMSEDAGLGLPEDMESESKNIVE